MKTIPGGTYAIQPLNYRLRDRADEYAKRDAYDYRSVDESLDRDTAEALEEAWAAAKNDQANIERLKLIEAERNALLDRGIEDRRVIERLTGDLTAIMRQCKEAEEHVRIAESSIEYHKAELAEYKRHIKTLHVKANAPAGEPGSEILILERLEIEKERIDKLFAALATLVHDNNAATLEKAPNDAGGTSYHLMLHVLMPREEKP